MKHTPFHLQYSLQPLQPSYHYGLLFLFVVFGVVVSSWLRLYADDGTGRRTLYAFVIESPLSPPQSSDAFNASTVKIINLGSAVNWQGIDYAPTVSADGKTLYFVSNRPGSKSYIKADQTKFKLMGLDTLSHDFWVTTKRSRLDTVFQSVINLDTGSTESSLNTPRDEGVASISADRRKFYFTGCDRFDGYGDCDIYVAEIQANGRWGKPQNLGSAINTSAWEGHPSITPKQDRLYFASNRKEGEGDMDIWFSDWDAKEKKWKPARNLGTTVNTSGREWSPFIAANNAELFFSSDGHSPNYGGTDFYVSMRDESDRWTRPRNLGEPINTPSDEAFLSAPAQRDVLYFASRRTDIPNFQGNYDIFMATVPSNAQAVTVSVSVIDECSGNPVPATISVYNKLTQTAFSDTVNAGSQNTLEFVVNDFDFGGSRSFAKNVTYTITAQHPRFGKVERSLVIERPNRGKRNIEVPPVVFRVGGKPSLRVRLDTADYVARYSAIKPAIRQHKGLVIEEITSLSVFRVLNYVFFDSAEAQIPVRYQRLKAEQTQGFTDSTIRGGTMEKYYHVLNVFGYRMQKFPQANVTITGCMALQEIEAGLDTSLARQRATVIATYLTDIWHIAPARIRIAVRALPAVASDENDSLSIEENRRVEIASDEWNIMRPISDREPTHIVLPQNIHFLPQTSSTSTFSPQATHSIVIERQKKPWRIIPFVPQAIQSLQDSIVFDWTNTEGQIPKDTVFLTAHYSVREPNGKECSADPIRIPILRITHEDKLRANIEEQTNERYALTLFPFDQAEFGSLNEKILREYILPRLSPQSTIEIAGYTDGIGMDDHNMSLSENRAFVVQKFLVNSLQGKYRSITARGFGETVKIFSEHLPEGRMYNRTVTLHITTPIRDIFQQLIRDMQ